MSRARFLFLAAAVIPVACDAPANVSSPPDFAPSADISPSPMVHVLNTQLRAVTPADGSTASAAYGHLQVKLQDNGDGTFTVDWKGRIFNPAREAITSGQVGIINPEVEPPPVGGGEIPLTPPPVFTFFRFAATDAVDCSVIDFDSQGIVNPEVMPAAIANNWIVNPDVHEARFMSVERMAGAVAGTFGAGTPEGAVDGAKVSGPRVRCSV